METMKFPAETVANFFHLINYTDSNVENISRDKAHAYLEQALEDDEYSNLGTYDLINYELLIFIECKFAQDKEI
jgi:Leucine-rich repeat (LRR) protein